MKQIVYTLTAILLFTSCSKCENIIDRTPIEIGDIYLKSGKIIHADEYIGSESPLGVVYFVENTLESSLAYIISLQEYKSKWSTNNELSNLKIDEGTSGRDNTTAIKLASANQEEVIYHLMDAYNDFIEDPGCGGFFIPSSQELLLINGSINIVNSTINHINGIPLIEDFYWTSTQVNKLQALKVTFTSPIKSTSADKEELVNLRFITVLKLR